MSQSPATEMVREAGSVAEARPLPAGWASALAGLSALTFSIIEGVCAGLVLLKGVALFSGLVALMAAGASSWLHQDQVRIPLMVFATAAALANLYIVWNGWRLRRAPAAAWRVRPLTAREKRRTTFVLLSSIVTLALIAGEIYGHHVLHAG